MERLFEFAASFSSDWEEYYLFRWFQCHIYCFWSAFYIFEIL